MAKRWIKKEIKILENLYKKHVPNNEIAKILKKSIRAVTCKAERLNLKKNPSIVTLKHNGGKYISRGGNSPQTFRRTARRILRNLGSNLNKKDVHHIDGDFTNNSPSNLQLLSRGEHLMVHRRQ